MRSFSICPWALSCEIVCESWSKTGRWTAAVQLPPHAHMWETHKHTGFNYPGILNKICRINYMIHNKYHDTNKLLKYTCRLHLELNTLSNFSASVQIFTNLIYLYLFLLNTNNRLIKLTSWLKYYFTLYCEKLSMAIWSLWPKEGCLIYIFSTAALPRALLSCRPVSAR